MRRYLLRIRPGREEWTICVEAPPRDVFQRPGYRAGHVPYVIVTPGWRYIGDGTGRRIGLPKRRENEHYRKAEIGLLDLARQVAAANPTRWVDVLDVTEPAAVNEAYRIVCRIEPAQLVVDDRQESLL